MRVDFISVTAVTLSDVMGDGPGKMTEGTEALLRLVASEPPHPDQANAYVFTVELTEAQLIEIIKGASHALPPRR